MALSDDRSKQDGRMADHPRFPEEGEHADPEVRPGAAGRPRWASVLLIALVVAALIAFVVLHLTGVLGPGSH
jgi:hypothetical protein